MSQFERFSTWTNNKANYIGGELNKVKRTKKKKQKTKRTKQNEENHTKTELNEKNLPFHDALYNFVFLYFSTARQAAFALHDKRW